MTAEKAGAPNPIKGGTASAQSTASRQLDWLMSYSYWLSLVLLVPTSLLAVRIFCLQHDCGHRSFFNSKWANDLEWVVPQGERFQSSVHYAENHDEVRLANPQHWGGHGMKVGKPVAAILFGMGRGPLLLYNGQEVGEPASELQIPGKENRPPPRHRHPGAKCRC